VRVAPGVVIGRRLSGPEARRLIADEDVTAVLDLTAEFAETRVLRGLTYRTVPVLDLMKPSPRHLDAAVGFIQEHAGKGTVFVHCALGLSRAACVAAAYLVLAGIAPTAEAATVSLRRFRPSIVCRDEAVGAIAAYCGA
jgi:protein-tyrosine phosphatase